MKVLEIAMIKYDKKGEYDHTLESKIIKENEVEDLEEYANKKALELKGQNFELYLYESEKDYENSSSYKTIECRKI